MLLAHKEFIREAYGSDDTKQSLDKKDGMPKGDNEGAKGGIDVSGNTVPRKSRIKSKSLGMLGPPTRQKWAERWRKELKFAKVRILCCTQPLLLFGQLSVQQRQYERLIEMLILRVLDPNDEAGQRAFRLQVKARIKTFNFVRDSVYFPCDAL